MVTHPDDAGPGWAVLGAVGVTSLFILSPSGQAEAVATSENTAVITADREQWQLGPTRLLWLLGQPAVTALQRRQGLRELRGPGSFLSQAR